MRRVLIQRWQSGCGGIGRLMSWTLRFFGAAFRAVHRQVALPGLLGRDAPAEDIEALRVRQAMKLALAITETCEWHAKETAVMALELAAKAMNLPVVVRPSVPMPYAIHENGLGVRRG